MKHQDKIVSDFNKVIETIDAKLGNGYASKNPDMIRHLLDKIQQQEDRKLTEEIHKR